MRFNVINKDNCCEAKSCSCCSCGGELSVKTERISETRLRDGPLENLDLLASGILFVLAFLPLYDWIKIVLYVISYLLAGREVIYKAVKNVIKGNMLDENFLMTIATLGAFAIQEFPEAAAVMLFYRIGEWLQDSVVKRSKSSIAKLMDISPQYANKVVGNEVKRVRPDEVAVGDIIVVKPGERIPLDGIVVKGQSAVDTSALTGEPLPRDVFPGASVLSGSVNQNGVIYVEVTSDFNNSTTSKILNLVEKAKNNKAPTERFITRFARYYTPVVVLAAVLIAIIPSLLWKQPLSEWVYRALVFLVVSCPCALVISIPVGFFGGLGGASRNGILVKGGQYLEALGNVDTVVFDKTGTLTKGVFKVVAVVPANGTTEEELLYYAALAEGFSNHPIALSIAEAYNKPLDQQAVDEHTEVPGHGVKVKINGKQVLVGSARFLKQHGVACPDIEAGGTCVHISIDGSYAGYILIEDMLKEDAKVAVDKLKRLGVKRTVMFTGDSYHAGLKVGYSLNLDEVHAELLPHQKVEKLEELEKTKSSKKSKIVFIGDGINDAPVLARADVGIAMGGVGSDAAIEAADVVFMTDEPSKLVTAIKIARRTKRIVWQNVIMALGVKLLVLLLGVAGLAGMWEAVFADVGVAVLSVLNASRVIKQPSFDG
ncbi:Cd2+/Zn2+-exporting ATPase [Caldicoprobacter guelmensis]|nr:Cd2+/Zn2+-exporting ATPase [Caldicoprobacter guelmensis]